jgi:hypothetical protein
VAQPHQAARPPHRSAPPRFGFRIEARTLERYIGNLFYESVNDVKIREHLRGSLGLCREPAQLTVDKKLGNSLGFAIIYQDVITNILRGLEKDATPPASARRLSSFLKQVPEQVSAAVQRVVYALTPHKHCPVCQQQEKTVHIIIVALVNSLNDPETAKAFQASDGLCIPHLKKAFESVRDPATYDLLLSMHREKLEGLLAELAEYIRKSDYRFQHEGFGAEGDSWRRAVNRLTGDRMYKNKKSSEE